MPHTDFWIFYYLGFHPRSFPGHQPEIDTAAAKAVYNDWNTTSTAAYQPLYGFSAASPASVRVSDNYIYISIFQNWRHIYDSN